MWRVFFLVLCASLCLSAAPAPQAPAEAGRFAAFDLVIDPHGQPLAAWQVEISGPADAVTVVALEGGDGVFDAPPYYDPKAVDGKSERVVLAAFSLEKAAKLPWQAVRVATVSLFVKGNAKVGAKLVVATDDNGKTLNADCTLKEEGK